jgi:tetratricopeptide (TPR) repeat protein
MKRDEPVQAREETVTIPTYPAPAADLNPMFVEKRVYQGSSGKVYPSPFTDRVLDDKRDHVYRAVFLENEYVKLMILPEIGGRIHVGQDKTNQFEFFYHQHVIKPALVGLLGPWISGGVEFNWPQHHRPSTFMPVDYSIEECADGSKIVWLSEHEPMNRMKGMVGVCLHPGKTLVEAQVRLYNRTPFVQTFLWWANVGVHTHEQYEAFFPPDVTYVTDHAKRATSEFPIARGFYYGVDYTRGVDLRWYKNIPVPTSYMVPESRYDFFGGYDHARHAGFVHVADNHISPGKKLWTWGNAEFGYAWDRELTDSDGPYVELMAGVYTDNQPDFSWLQPYETKTFRQYWYPIREIGPAVNANRKLALSLEINHGKLKLGACAAENLPGAKVILSSGKKVFFEQAVNLDPVKPLVEQLNLPSTVESTQLLLRVVDTSGKELIRYQPENLKGKSVGQPATEPPPPEQTKTNEDLYLTGLHLEQYRHATRYAESYWRELLNRDPGDVRANNAMGLQYLRRGQFQESEIHFRRAIQRLSHWNPNPPDGEPYYNLGLALKFQNRIDESYSAFYKAAWNYAWQGASYYALAEIDCRHGRYDFAIEHLEHALAVNASNLKARALQSSILRRTGQVDRAENLALETVRMDPLDFWSRNELALASRAKQDDKKAESRIRELRHLMRGNVQTCLDIAFDYSNAGLWDEALELLARLLPSNGGVGSVYPIVLYALAFFHEQMGNSERACNFRRRASTASPDYCFPARLEELLILESAQAANPEDPKACYYLGNLLYDKKRYEEAIGNWEKSCELDPSFSIPWRNLGIAYYNVRHDAARAVEAYRRAFEDNPADSRLLYEMDQLSKRTGASPDARLENLEKYHHLVEQRDDLTIEQVTLYNQTGKPEKALQIVLTRRFHPWEGGEGLVSGQYVLAHLVLGLKCLKSGKAQEALEHFEEAQHYPENLGEGKHLLTPENPLYYFSGLAYEALNERAEAKRCFEKAAKPGPNRSPMVYYQALASRKLGDEEAASKALRELLDESMRREAADVKIDYFATSLPNFLLFEDDLQKRNRIDGLFLAGLAQSGLNRREQAEAKFQQVLELDVNHFWAQLELEMLFRAEKKPK